MLRLTPRQLALAGCIVLLIAVIAAVADTAHGAPTSRAYVKAVVCEVFGTRCAQALRVVRCETGGTFSPWAVGDHGASRGLFQINEAHWGWVNEKRLFEPAYNTLIAYRLSRGGTDWRHWTCRP